MFRKIFFMAVLSLYSAVSIANCELETDRELSRQHKRNLMFFAKIYGSVRYFYPSKAAIQTDWDKFAIYGVHEVKDCKDDSELIEKINDLFLPVCQELKINTVSENIMITHRERGLKFWEHYGNGNSFMKIPLIYHPYHSKVKRLHNDTIHLYSDKVDENLFFTMPAVSKETKINKRFKSLKQAFDTISTNKASIKEKVFFINADSYDYQIASIIIVWNNMRFFFPYNDVIKIDWDENLQNAITKTSLIDNYIDFYYVFNEMLSPLNDGHIGINPLVCAKSIGPFVFVRDAKLYYFPLKVFINDTAITVIDVVTETSIQPPIGSVIDSINGISGMEWVEKRMNFISGSKHYKLNYLERFLLESYKDSIFVISFTTPDGKKDVLTHNAKAIVPYTKYDFFPDNKRPFLQQQDEGIYSLNFNSEDASNAMLKKSIKKLRKERNLKGIIIDYRNPRITVNPSLLGYFSKADIYCTDLKTPVKTFPDEFNYSIDRWKIKAKRKPFEIPTVLLIDASVISSGETLTGIIDHYKLCDIIGENTAGANGDVASVNTPTFDITYTGMRVDKHDGCPFFGTGYEPNIYVGKTAQDLINKRDPQMHKAIEVIRLKNSLSANISIRFSK